MRKDKESGRPGSITIHWITKILASHGFAYREPWHEPYTCYCSAPIYIIIGYPKPSGSRQRDRLERERAAISIFADWSSLSDHVISNVLALVLVNTIT